MGPESQGMPKVEFFLIFLLLAFFRLAHIFITPAQQYSIITSMTPSLIGRSAAFIISSFFWFQRALLLLEWIFWTPIHLFVDIVDWLAGDGFAGLIVIISSMVIWTQSFFRWLHHSWEWWLTLIVGLWNAPDGRKLMSILRHPTWFFDKPQISHLQLRQYYTHLQWKLHDIERQQHRHFGTMSCIMRSPSV